MATFELATFSRLASLFPKLWASSCEDARDPSPKRNREIMHDDVTVAWRFAKECQSGHENVPTSRCRKRVVLFNNYYHRVPPPLAIILSRCDYFFSCSRHSCINIKMRDLFNTWRMSTVSTHPQTFVRIFCMKMHAEICRESCRRARPHATCIDFPSWDSSSRRHAGSKTIFRRRIISRIHAVIYYANCRVVF